MTLADVRSLYAYNRWANERLLEVIRQLPEDRLTAHVASSFPSVLATLAHLAAAEWVWLRRFLGESPTAFPSWLTEPALGEVSRRLAAVDAEREAFLTGLSEAQLQEPLAYKTLDGQPFENRLLDLLVHVVNHSTYHRGQLTTQLRQVGATPVATDFVLFKRPGA